MVKVLHLLKCRVNPKATCFTKHKDPIRGLFWGFKKQNAHLGGAFFFPTWRPLFCFLPGYLAGITEKKEKNIG
jgi:hypothetical protein